MARDQSKLREHCSSIAITTLHGDPTSRLKTFAEKWKTANPRPRTALGSPTPTEQKTSDHNVHQKKNCYSLYFCFSSFSVSPREVETPAVKLSITRLGVAASVAVYNSSDSRSNRVALQCWVEVLLGGDPPRYRLRAGPRGRALREARPQSRALSCLRPLLSHPRGPARRLQSSLQPRRHSVRTLGIRRRRAVRSHREKAVFPRLSGRAGLQFRNVGMRSVLWLLPELGHVPSVARSQRNFAAA